MRRLKQYETACPMAGSRKRSGACDSWARRVAGARGRPEAGGAAASAGQRRAAAGDERPADGRGSAPGGRGSAPGVSRNAGPDGRAGAPVPARRSWLGSPAAPGACQERRARPPLWGPSRAQRAGAPAGQPLSQHGFAVALSPTRATAPDLARAIGGGSRCATAIFPAGCGPHRPSAARRRLDGVRAPLGESEFRRLRAAPGPARAASRRYSASPLWQLHSANTSWF